MFKITKLKKFGTIEKIEDDIFLNDLTIFMGDNSAGKSYLAIFFDRLINIEKEIKSSNLYSEFLEKEIMDLLNKIELEKNIDISKEISTQGLENIIESVIKNFTKKYFSFLITKSFDINIFYNIKNKVTLFIKKSQTNSIYEFFIEISLKEKNNEFGIEGKRIIEISKFSKKLFTQEIMEMILLLLIKASVNIPSSNYLPSARTGYLHTKDILLNYAIDNTFFKNSKNKEKLPIWIIDFLKKLSFSKEIIDNNFNKFLEEKLLNGKVKVYKDNTNIDFFIKNSRGNYNKKIDLIHTSSSISELIPLVVFLKRGFIFKNSLLIIEEPEAHLSFKNQKLMAKLIAMFINNGIKVLITTHSDYLIYELNNLILANNISKDKRPEEYKEISIDYKKVNVYNFILKNQKSIVKKVGVSKEGINNPFIVEALSDRIDSMHKLYELIESENES